VCKVKGCDNKPYRKGLCRPHDYRAKKYGDPLARTKRDPNEIINNGDVSYICLYKDCQVIAHAIIDTKNVPLVEGCVWYLDTDGYVKSNTEGKRKLHRLICGNPEGKVIDHWNHNKLDNTEDNLKVGTQLDNNQNIVKRVDNTSGHTGVRKREDTGKWRAYISVNKKPISLGSFATVEEAVEARKKAEQKYFGTKEK